MNRYFFYLIATNMLVNVIVWVPKILLAERFDGAVMAIPIGVLIGTIFLFLFVSAINKFPNLGIPEILEQTPGLFRFSFLFLFSVMWFLAGVITLLSFVDHLVEFVNPEMPSLALVILFLFLVIIVLRYSDASKLLYALEILLVLNVPLILIIMYQAYTNEYLTMDSIFEVGTHLFEIPSWSAISSVTYIFSGYANMVIFNRVFNKKISMKLLAVIPFVAIGNLLTSFFIPIGLWGADGVGELAYPWTSTADTLSIEYGPVERVITVFILLYVSITTMSILIHWYVALEMIKSMFNIKRAGKIKKFVTNWAALLSFGIASIILETMTTNKSIGQLSEIWLDIRFPFEAVLVVFMFFLARRKKA
ncbi:GerAB/ArcD/ProY family transporter [Metabacillus fastidiosus]|uniref:GerAB/ArcD/ProY family transporter n=1 Tax=Metabacillus fastidiosus TaxID=1458 RepID=UPI003D26923C